MKTERIIIDVREPIEYMFGHVKGAINIPSTKLLAGAAKLDGVPKDAEVIVYCMSGSRAASAINLLSRIGYTNVKNGVNKEQVNAAYMN